MFHKWKDIRDKDVWKVKEFQTIKVLSAKEFLEVLEKL